MLAANPTQPCPFPNILRRLDGTGPRRTLHSVLREERKRSSCPPRWYRKSGPSKGGWSRPKTTNIFTSNDLVYPHVLELNPGNFEHPSLRLSEGLVGRRRRMITPSASARLVEAELAEGKSDR